MMKNASSTLVSLSIAALYGLALAEPAAAQAFSDATIHRARLFFQPPHEGREFSLAHEARDSRN